MAMVSTGFTVKVIGRLSNNKTTTVMTLSHLGIGAYKIGQEIDERRPSAVINGSLVYLPIASSTEGGIYGRLVSILEAAQALTSAKIIGYVLIMEFVDVSSTASPGDVLASDEIFKAEYADNFDVIPILKIVGKNPNTANSVTSNLRYAADPFETENYSSKLSNYKNCLFENDLGAATNQNASIYFSVSKDVLE